MAPRVLVVAGPGGAGSSTMAAGIADHLAAAGRPVTVLDNDPYTGARSRCAEAIPAAGPAAAPAASKTVDLQSLLSVLGDSAEVVEPLRHTDTAAALRLLWSIPVEASDEHIVVVDAGSNGPDLARLARMLPASLLQLSRVSSKWLRTARPFAAAVGGKLPGPELLRQVQDSAERARAIRNAVCGGSGGALLVGGDPGKTARIGVGVALSGVLVRGVVGLENGPEDLLPGVPRVASPADWLASDWDTQPPVQIVADMTDEGYQMRMPLPLSDFRELKLRWSGHSLTLAATGHQSVLDLPSVLQRCRPSSASLRDGMLDVAFRPTRAGA